VIDQEKKRESERERETGPRKKINSLLYCGSSLFRVLQASRHRFCREKSNAQVTGKKKKKIRERTREKKMLMKTSHG